jgi:hypothetical protein
LRPAVRSRQVGAGAGWYKVLVTALAPADANAKDPYAPRPAYINLKYHSLETTDLQVEILDQPDRAYDLTLTK